MTLYSQNLRTVCSIPGNLAENSGVLVSNSNSIWLHNDGGDMSKLYIYAIQNYADWLAGSLNFALIK